MTTAKPRNILRLREVCNRTGLKHDSVYRGMRASPPWFPRNFKITPNGSASGWLESEIDDWIAKRAAQRDSEPNPSGDQQPRDSAAA